MFHVACNSNTLLVIQTLQRYCQYQCKWSTGRTRVRYDGGVKPYFPIKPYSFIHSTHNALQDRNKVDRFILNTPQGHLRSIQNDTIVFPFSKTCVIISRKIKNTRAKMRKMPHTQRRIPLKYVYHHLSLLSTISILDVYICCVIGTSNDRYGILGFNVPLDTVYLVISETGGPEQWCASHIQ